MGPLRIITSRWGGFRICQFYCFALQVFLFPGATRSRAGDPSPRPPTLFFVIFPLSILCLPSCDSVYPVWNLSGSCV